jgi:hypothetical protein
MLKTILLETFIFEDESGIKTGGPSNVDKVQGGSHDAVIELSDDQEPYVTPFPLAKKKRKVAPPPEDTEAEQSDMEQQLRGKMGKKAGAKESSTDKVR